MSLVRLQMASQGIMDGTRSNRAPAAQAPVSHDAGNGGWGQTTNGSGGGWGNDASSSGVSGRW